MQPLRDQLASTPVSRGTQKCPSAASLPDLQELSAAIDLTRSAAEPVAPDARSIIDLDDEFDQNASSEKGKDGEEAGAAEQDEDEDDDEIQELLAVDCSPTPAPRSRRSRPSTALPPRRNAALQLTMRRLDSFSLHGTSSTLRVNKSVELSDGDFLRITAIIQDARTTEVYLRGWRLKRAGQLLGVLEKKHNEVVLMLDVDSDDDRDPLVQSVHEVPLAAVVRVRRIIMTNRPFPSCSFRESEPAAPKTVVREKYHLVCRWKFIKTFDNARARADDVSREKALVGLRSHECDRDAGVTDASLRLAFRGATIRGGSCLGPVKGEPDFRRAVPQEARSGPSPEHASGARRRAAVVSLDDAPVPFRARLAAVASRGSTSATSAIDIDGDQSVISSPATLAPPPGPLLDEPRLRPLPARSTSADIFWLGSVDPRTTSGDVALNDAGTVPSPPNAGSDSRPYGSQRTQSLPGVSDAAKRGIQSAEWPYGSVESQESPSSPAKRRRMATSAETQSPSLSDALPVKPQRLHALSTGGNEANVTPRAVTVANGNTPRSTSRRAVPQRYSFGDGFCGAGGASHGAVKAGLRVQWGFDMDAAAVNTYRMNFPAADVHHSRVDQFIAMPDDDLDVLVDVLHLSPPCQTFSSAHTIAGKDDDTNQASFLSLDYIISKAKPRIATLENTSGMTSRHGAWVGKAVHMFTAQGFSVRWRLLNCAEFGLCQARQRLFMIASW